MGTFVRNRAQVIIIILFFHERTWVRFSLLGEEIFINSPDEQKSRAVWNQSIPEMYQVSILNNQPTIFGRNFEAFFLLDEPRRRNTSWSPVPPKKHTQNALVYVYRLLML
jgi:hypothetical protein